MKRISLISMAIMLFASCNNVPVIDFEPDKGDTLKENLLNANRYIAQSEETQIDAYIARRGWEMRKLSGGARVMETSQGSGVSVEYEDTVTITYRLEAINGTVIYSNETETVVAGRLQPTRGLDAALLILHHGSTAKIILPSEQGYGVVGDGDRVKSRMILVYDLKVE